MTTTRTGYRIHAVPVTVLDEVRATGRDVSGNQVVRVSAGGGEPLRKNLSVGSGGVSGFSSPVA